jgi:hypothetical protein
MRRPVPIKPLSKSARLGWSHSRYETFSNCKRMYYYQYYGRYDKDFPSNRIWQLKSLTSAALTVGDVAHRTVERILRRLITTEIPIDRGRLDEFIRREVHGDVSEKEFFEIHYRKLTGVDEEEIFRKTRECVVNFVESDRFRWILEEGTAAKQDWIIEPPEFGETSIEGCKAYAKFDFLCRDGERILIFDWKTGSQDIEKHARQLTAYSFWASYHLDADPESVVPIIAYLYPEYEEVECGFDGELYREFAETVRSQTAEMESYLEDVNRNLPTSKERFEMRDYSKYCDYCNFNELCWGDGK